MIISPKLPEAQKSGLEYRLWVYYYQLTNEDFFLGIERPCHDVEQLSRLRLELVLRDPRQLLGRGRRRTERGRRKRRRLENRPVQRPLRPIQTRGQRRNASQTLREPPSRSKAGHVHSVLPE